MGSNMCTVFYESSVYGCCEQIGKYEVVLLWDMYIYLYIVNILQKLKDKNRRL